MMSFISHLWSSIEEFYWRASDEEIYGRSSDDEFYQPLVEPSVVHSKRPKHDYKMLWCFRLLF
jgi:hypothetical protein